MNATLPSSAIQNSKWKFVGHVEQFRRAFAIVFAPFHLSLSLHTHACLLLKWPSERGHFCCGARQQLRDLCPSGSHLSMDCIGLWMSVPSRASSHPSWEKQSDNRPEFKHRFPLTLSKISSTRHKIMSSIIGSVAPTIERKIHFKNICVGSEFE